MAAGQAVLPDEDGGFPDWLEIFNAGPEIVDLRDWHLTDDPAKPTEWTFPRGRSGQGSIFSSSPRQRIAGRQTARCTLISVSRVAASTLLGIVDQLDRSGAGYFLGPQTGGALRLERAPVIFLDPPVAPVTLPAPQPSP